MDMSNNDAYPDSTQFGPLAGEQVDPEDQDREKWAYWNREIKASEKMLEDYHKKANKTVRKFLDTRKGDGSNTEGLKRLNLFHSDVKTLMAFLYGNTPKVDVSRRWQDPNDDIGRVASLIMERILNADIQDNANDYKSVFTSVLEDRLVPGCGSTRVRYDAKTVREGDGDAAVLKTAWEDAPVEYFHWRDVLWGWCRVPSEMPWRAYRSYLTKQEVTKRFNAEIAASLEYEKTSYYADQQENGQDPDKNDSTPKAAIWEIWDRKSHKVRFFNDKYQSLLASERDRLDLEGFFPSPPDLIANCTTTLYAPMPDYYFAQDQYLSIDRLTSRIDIITEAVRVVGVYDKSEGNSAVGRMFKEGMENSLIPVDNYAMFAEKGGLKGVIDWYPVQEVVGVLATLSERRDEEIRLLHEVTGIGDLMRGNLNDAREGVGQSKMRTNLGTVRIQQLQDEFAEYVSEVMRLKAEIISKHWDVETILARSNINATPDQGLAAQAVALIKNPAKARLRVKILPETVAMQDYAQIQGERTEFMQQFGFFLQSAGQMDESPHTVEMTGELMKWFLASFKGSQEIEGVIDRWIDAESKRMTQKQAQEQNQPSPEMIKIQGQLQVIQAKNQGEMQKIMASNQAEMAREKADLMAEIAKINAKLQADLLLADRETQYKLMEEAAQSQAAIMEEYQKARIEINKQQQLPLREVQSGT